MPAFLPLHIVKQNLAFIALVVSTSLSAVEPLPLMPHIEDQTQMWWAEGFSGTIPNSTLAARGSNGFVCGGAEY